MRIHRASPCNFSRLASALCETACPEYGDSGKFQTSPLPEEVIGKYRIVKEKYEGRKCSSYNVRSDACALHVRCASAKRVIYATIKDEEKK